MSSFDAIDSNASAERRDGADSLARSVSVGERRFFWACVLASGALMWLAPRLPMIDLPQHAGQIALWRDLLKGVSPWSDLVRINLTTPYLIGYGAALPLSFFMSPEAATSVVLTFAFYAFVAASVSLRRELGGDDRLDWLFLPGFFGFDWKWGFYTFLTAAPVLLWFLLCALKYRKAPSAGRGLGLVAIGACLLFAHGLAFLFALFTAGLLLIGPLRESLTLRARRLAPLAALGALLILYVYATREHGMTSHYDGFAYGTPIWLRPLSALMFIVSDNWDPDLPLTACAAVAMMTPFFIGGRWNRGPALILLAAVSAFYMLVPSEAFETGYLFPRFVLFFPVFYALAFTRSATETRVGSEGLSRVVMICACLAILGVDAYRIRAFARESEDFVTIENAIPQARRVLGIIFDGASEAAHASKAYVAWYAWYQADRGGFVDYNFADLPPQVVRFKLDQKPLVGLEFVHDPESFDWEKQQGWIYDDFILRGAADPIGWLKRRSPCSFSVAAARGPWTVVRRDSCPGAATP